MRFINMPRRSGKTKMLIEAAYITGYPIIAFDSNRAKLVKEQAEKMGLVIDVFSLQEFKRRDINNYFNNALIDEGTNIIELALKETLGTNVAACTLTLPMIDIQQNKEGLNNE